MSANRPICFGLCMLWIFSQQCCGVVTHIPSPNVCKLASTNGILADWTSPDCPPTAVCVPFKGNDTYGYCSCELKPEYFKLEGSKCVPSTHSIVLAVFFGLVCVASLCAAIFGLHQLMIAHRCRVLKMSAIFAMGAIVIPGMLAGAILKFCLVIVFTNESLTLLEIVGWIIRVDLLLEGLCALTCGLLFGLSIKEFVAQSEQLRTIDQKKSRRVIVRRTILCGVVYAAFVGPLAIFAQWGIAALVSVVVALVLLIMYNNTLSRFIKLRGGAEILRSVGSGKAQTNQTLQIIHQLCSRLLCAVTVSCVFCVVSIIAWFIGRHERSSILLGVVFSWATLGLHTSVFAAGLFILLFLRKLVAIRSGQVTSSQQEAEITTIGFRSVVSTSPEPVC